VSGGLREGRAWRASVGAVVALTVCLLPAAIAAPALAQVPGEGTPPATAGPAPTVVVAPRDLRMNLAGVIVLRVGCLGPAGGCGGRLEARLARPIEVRGRRWAPFVLGRGRLGIGAGLSRVIRFRFYPRGARLVRLAGTVPVTIIARTPGGVFPKTIHVYVSPLQRLP
jgi:hypothetical protein